MPKCLNQKLILCKDIAISDFVPIEIEKKKMFCILVSSSSQFISHIRRYVREN